MAELFIRFVNFFGIVRPRCQSVRHPSVTLVWSIETSKLILKLFSPSDSPTLVYRSNSENLRGFIIVWRALEIKLRSAPCTVTNKLTNAGNARQGGSMIVMHAAIVVRRARTIPSGKCDWITERQMKTQKWPSKLIMKQENGFMQTDPSSPRAFTTQLERLVIHDTDE